MAWVITCISIITVVVSLLLLNVEKAKQDHYHAVFEGIMMSSYRNAEYYTFQHRTLKDSTGLTELQKQTLISSYVEASSRFNSISESVYGVMKSIKPEKQVSFQQYIWAKYDESKRAAQKTL